LELIRRFTKGYVRFSDHPKVKEIGKKINEYNKQLEFYGLKDYQVFGCFSKEIITDILDSRFGTRKICQINSDIDD
jgi:hypothetical protein